MHILMIDKVTYTMTDKVTYTCTCTCTYVHIPTLQRLTLVLVSADSRVSKLSSPATSHLDNLGNSYIVPTCTHIYYNIIVKVYAVHCLNILSCNLIW